MKIEPSFCDHWKTKRLHRICGAEAVLGLLRLWGQAKIRREYTGLVLNPTKLAAIMEYPGDESLLWATMTDPAAPWLDGAQDGTWSLHGYAEHQAQIIRLWEIGRKGGRPAKAVVHSSTNPINTSSSSSSSPICEPNGNHMVFQTPTLEEFIETGRKAGIEREIAEEIWHDNESRPITPYGQWTDYRGNPIVKWQANMMARASQIRARRGNGVGRPNGNGKGAPESVWATQQRIDAATKEIERIQANPSNKEQVEDSFDRRLKAQPMAKVRALKASISEMRQRIAGVGVAA
jgi:hypothetical protein